MSRYLMGTLSSEIETAIVEQAKKDAATAISEGATAPWGDGETLPDVDDLLFALPKSLRPDRDDSDARQTYASCYDLVFREEIDRLGADADEPTTLYIVETREAETDDRRAGEWHSDGIGANEPRTRAECQETVAAAEREWAHESRAPYEYRIVEA